MRDVDTTSESYLLQTTLRRLGVLNGLLIGLALALGAWGPEAITLITRPLQQYLPALIFATIILVLIGGLAGWLSSWTDRMSLSAFIWIASGVLMIFVIGHLPYEGRSISAWLLDSRFQGLSIYPFDETAQVRLALAGFLVVAALMILSLTQSYRLEGLHGTLNANQRLSMQSLILLALPLIVVFGAGLVSDDLIARPLRIGPQMVDDAIRTVRTYEGDLLELSRGKSVNYNALAGVRDMLSEDYSLLVGEFEIGASQKVVVVAHFDDGTWINCQLPAGQLSFCYDASPTYYAGFQALLNGEELDDCRNCNLEASTDVRNWLRQHRSKLADTARISRLAQWGSYVFMRAESDSTDFAIECLFHGHNPVTVEKCTEVSS